MRVLVVVGHTGGHVYPALCLAQELHRRRPDADVRFVGPPGGFSRWPAVAGGACLETVRSAPLRGGSATTVLRGVVALPRSFGDAGALLRRLRPRVVVGLGSYASGPVLVSARLAGIPALLLEPNVLPGLANRMLGSCVAAAAVSWATTAGFFGRKAFLSGTPVRPELARPIAAPAEGELRVLVLGGSQGSSLVNAAMMAALPDLARAGVPVAFRHQAGDADAEAVGAAYRRAGIPSRVEPFIEAMDNAYAGCHVVVSPAGAVTCAELAAVGRPAILVPLPVAGRHQEENARAMSATGATVTVPPGAGSGPLLARALLDVAASPARREGMAARARALARPEAAAVIVGRVLELAG